VIHATPSVARYVNGLSVIVDVDGEVVRSFVRRRSSSVRPNVWNNRQDVKRGALGRPHKEGAECHRSAWSLSPLGSSPGALAPAVVRAQTSVKIGTAVLGDYPGRAVEGRRAGLSAPRTSTSSSSFAADLTSSRPSSSGEVLLGAAGSTDILVFREGHG
jgi:hypothetical protein